MRLRLNWLLLVGVLLACAAGCGGGTLGAKVLSQQSDALRSNAAEGALLAEDAFSGRSTRVFTREHSSALSEVAAKVEASLKAARTTPALAPELHRLAVLAAHVRDDLRRLGSASREEQRALGRELRAAARASEKIGEGLA